METLARNGLKMIMNTPERQVNIVVVLLLILKVFKIPFNVIILVLFLTNKPVQSKQKDLRIRSLYIVLVQFS